MVNLAFQRAPEPKRRPRRKWGSVRAGQVRSDRLSLPRMLIGQPDAIASERHKSRPYPPSDDPTFHGRGNYALRSAESLVHSFGSSHWFVFFL
jgi:hypothetical protein